MRFNITPRRASGLAPPSAAPVFPRTRPLLLAVTIRSKRQRAIACQELPSLLRRQAD